MFFQLLAALAGKNFTSLEPWKLAEHQSPDIQRPWDRLVCLPQPCPEVAGNCHFQCQLRSNGYFVKLFDARWSDFRKATSSMTFLKQLPKLAHLRCNASHNDGNAVIKQRRWYTVQSIMSDRIDAARATHKLVMETARKEQLKIC